MIGVGNSPASEEFRPGCHSCAPRGEVMLLLPLMLSEGSIIIAGHLPPPPPPPPPPPAHARPTRPPSLPPINLLQATWLHCGRCFRAAVVPEPPGRHGCSWPTCWGRCGKMRGVERGGGGRVYTPINWSFPRGPVCVVLVNCRLSVIFSAALSPQPPISLPPHPPLCMQASAEALPPSRSPLPLLHCACKPVLRLPAVSADAAILMLLNEWLEVCD